MNERREFLRQATAFGALGCLPHLQPVFAYASERASKRLRILILGGTGYLGPHYVQAAQSRGHKLSLFIRNTGKERSLLKGVETLMGDRNGDLDSLKNRTWDAVIDLATYGPIWVRTLAEALKGRVAHYTFISTINVYDKSTNSEPFVDENSKLAEYHGTTDPYTFTSPGEYYGELKVLCEREAQRQFPGKTLILRPSYIVGPGDRAGALTYWTARMEKGGEVLAAGDPLSRLHAIDVRDKAAFAIDMIERGQTGVFNAVGPEPPTTWGGLLKQLRALSSTPTPFTWVPVSWLVEHQITGPFNHFVFWTSGASSNGAKLIKNDKARAKGLAMRPLLTSARDAWAWCQAQPLDQQKNLLMLDGLPSLDACLAREQKLLAVWRADAGLI